ncbi:hypothetical protein PVAND_013421 [Polypedilum vanderplanki]|uniref:Cilia- and flagella-associated protein 206 n=1 Tax=Polypedilum vanderplanki TaxID=319348 RepID=A0A9J6CQ97_POLVA|nr:hypothetical protein PVAND_013421 [Polypedilum vanderplanki]
MRYIVRKLLSNLKSIKSLIETHVKNFAEKLAKLHEIVQYRSAVPSIQIFPKFRELTDDGWHSMIFLMFYHNRIRSTIICNICQSCAVNNNMMKLCTSYWVKNQVETDHTRLQKRRHLKLDAENISSSSSISIVQAPESNSEIEYLGFCAYVLAESRILLPSVPEMGCALWNQKFYGFYSVEAAKLFIAKPINFIQLTLTHCLMEVRMQMMKQLLSEREFRLIYIQFHFIRTRIMYGILWELRKKAIELANLRRKKTTSSQTGLSYHRFEIASEKLENRQNDSQTNENKAN